MILSTTQLILLASVLALVLLVIVQAAAKMKHRSPSEDYRVHREVQPDMQAFRARYPQVLGLMRSAGLVPGVQTGAREPALFQEMALVAYVQVALDLSLYVIPLALLQVAILGISARKLLAPVTKNDTTQGAVGVGYVIVATLADAGMHDLVRLLFDLAATKAKGGDVNDFFRSIPRSAKPLAHMMWPDGWH